MRTQSRKLDKTNLLPTKKSLVLLSVLIALSACAKNEGSSPAADTSVPQQQQSQQPDVPVATPKPEPNPLAVPSATPSPNPQATPSATPQPKLTDPVVATATPPPGPKPSPTPVAPHKPSKLPPSYYAAAVWASTPGTEAWTNAVIAAIRIELPKLEKAGDIDTFCPRYESASRRHREICWLRVISGLAKFESNFNPKMSFKEPDGRMSIGLLQVSNGECVLTSGTPDLKNPVSNLKCGIAIMARLVDQDHDIDGPPWSRGASAYWSTLRPAYEFLGMLLGKKSEVTVLTETYESYYLFPSHNTPPRYLNAVYRPCKTVSQQGDRAWRRIRNYRSKRVALSRPKRASRFCSVRARGSRSSTSKANRSPISLHLI